MSVLCFCSAHQDCEDGADAGCPACSKAFIGWLRERIYDLEKWGLAELEPGHNTTACLLCAETQAESRRLAASRVREFAKIAPAIMTLKAWEGLAVELEAKDGV